MKLETLVTSGKFKLDGGEWDVDNNVYIVADDQTQHCYIVDPSHDKDAIVAAVEKLGAQVKGIILTHGHSDHIDIAPDVAEHFGVAMYMHPEDDMLWQESNPDSTYEPLAEGQTFELGKDTLEVLHTPGHSPGCVVLYNAAEGILLSGDTLFSGGPGATGRKYSDFDVIVESLQTKVMTLPEDVRVLPGHGDATTVGAEKARMDEYIERGY